MNGWLRVGTCGIINVNNPRESNPTTTAMSKCQVEQQGYLAILTPTLNLIEPAAIQDFEVAVDKTLAMLEKGEVRHVIIDFNRTDFLGSHAMMLMRTLSKNTRSLGGKMAVAELSAQQKEALRPGLGWAGSGWSILPERMRLKRSENDRFLSL